MTLAFFSLAQPPRGYPSGRTAHGVHAAEIASPDRSALNLLTQASAPSGLMPTGHGFHPRRNRGRVETLDRGCEDVSRECTHQIRRSATPSAHSVGTSSRRVPCTVSRLRGLPAHGSRGAVETRQGVGPRHRVCTLSRRCATGSAARRGSSGSHQKCWHAERRCRGRGCPRPSRSAPTRHVVASR